MAAAILDAPFPSTRPRKDVLIDSRR
jgi:hypothetical protein